MKYLWLGALGMLSSLTFGDDLPHESRRQDVFWLEHGFQVAVDAEPAWLQRSYTDGNIKGLLLTSPEYYYPPTTFNLRYHSGQVIDKSDRYFERLALGVAQAAAEESSARLKMHDLNRAVYRKLKGHQIDLAGTLDGKAVDTRLLVLRNENKELLTLQVMTPQGKLEHAQHAFLRFIRSIKFLQLQQ